MPPQDDLSSEKDYIDVGGDSRDDDGNNWTSAQSDMRIRDPALRRLLEAPNVIPTSLATLEDLREVSCTSKLLHSFTHACFADFSEVSTS